jgi:L-lactate dehydrogenase complex protein LldG
MTARDEILARIRLALGADRGDSAAAREYQPAAARGDVTLFTERVADYRATVHRCASSEVGETAARVLAELAISRVVVPSGFPSHWLPHVDVVDEPVDTTTLDEVGAVLTTCALAIAETGTIVLDSGPGQGARALTLVPDVHLVVVDTGQIRAAVPDAVADLDPTRAMTWISGPSATSDIELDRVEGVHGPRVLHVIVSNPDSSVSATSQVSTDADRTISL